MYVYIQGRVVPRSNRQMLSLFLVQCGCLRRWKVCCDSCAEVAVRALEIFFRVFVGFLFIVLGTVLACCTVTFAVVVAFKFWRCFSRFLIIKLAVGVSFRISPKRTVIRMFRMVFKGHSSASANSRHEHRPTNTCIWCHFWHLPSCAICCPFESCSRRYGSFVLRIAVIRTVRRTYFTVFRLLRVPLHKHAAWTHETGSRFRSCIPHAAQAQVCSVGGFYPNFTSHIVLFRTSILLFCFSLRYHRASAAGSNSSSSLGGLGLPVFSAFRGATSASRLGGVYCCFEMSSTFGAFAPYNTVMLVICLQILISFFLALLFPRHLFLFPGTINILGYVYDSRFELKFHLVRMRKFVLVACCRVCVCWGWLKSFSKYIYCAH